MRENCKPLEEVAHKCRNSMHKDSFHGIKTMGFPSLLSASFAAEALKKVKKREIKDCLRHYFQRKGQASHFPHNKLTLIWQN